MTKEGKNSVITVGINGFGRIGRNVFYALANDSRFRLVAINQHGKKGNPKEMVKLVKRDPVLGPFPGEVQLDETGIVVNGQHVDIFNGETPEEIPWTADYVIDCTGKFKTRQDLKGHFASGTVKKVLMSAPAKDETIPMFVMGVNQDKCTKDMDIVSNASCTTNCLAPVAKVIQDNFGIETGVMHTVHATTDSQKPTDVLNNITAHSTGAAKALGEVVPEMAGKIMCDALRVPVKDGSVVLLDVVLERATTIEEIREAMKKAADGSMKGVLHYVEGDIDVTDILGDSHTSIFNVQETQMVGDRFLSLRAWYDNEWGYSCKCLDLLHLMANLD